MVSHSNRGRNFGNRTFFYEIEASLVEYIELRTRYDTPDENGEKRRDRNEKFDGVTPEFAPPEVGAYLLDWFDELATMVGRTWDGVCHSIPPTEYLAWREMFGHVVRPHEFIILRAMDKAFCKAMNQEFEDYRARIADKGNKPT